jgi:hypothetical protein
MYYFKKYTPIGNGIWFFPEATINVDLDEILISAEQINVLRFSSLDLEDKQGATTPEELVDIWAIAGRYQPVPQESNVTEPNTDLGGALYVEGITTDIDLKQTKCNLPLFYSRVNNGTATQTHSTANACTVMAVTANNDYAIAQTFQRFNYQTGKTKFIQMTFVNMESEEDVTKRVGYFDGGTVAPYSTYDGIFLEATPTEMNLCVAKGGIVNRLPREQWADKLDGLGESGITADFSKSHILRIEFLWLGFGGVKFSLLIGGQIIELGYIASANIDDSVFMQSPNQPVRYEIRSTGGAGSLTQVCATVGQYGGSDTLGMVRSATTGVTALAFATSGTKYLMLGMRQKTTHTDVKIGVLEHQVLCTSNDDFLYQIILNPTIAGVVTFAAETNSAIEIAVGIATNIVTGGTVLHSGIGKQNIVAANALENALRLGAAINGTRDVIALCFTPLSAGASAYGIINWLESN